MTNSNQSRFLRSESERKNQVKLNGFIAEVAPPSRAILVPPGFSFRHQFIETCSKQLRSEIKVIACKMTENTLNCWCFVTFLVSNCT